MAVPPYNTTTGRFKTFVNTNNDISTSPSIDARPGHIPDDVDTIMTRANESEPLHLNTRLQCCCGRPECVFLENNNTLLGGIERDLETAARLGQALLNRHESYVNESQREHTRLTAYVEELEQKQTDLQTTNEKIVEENRGLLDKLEAANNSLKSTDNHVQNLEALLRDCEVEVRRLNGLTRRTEELELKMLDMEKERILLSQKVEDATEETKSTIRRWKDSEMRVRQLEYDVQRIEWEARRDKERHEEIVARLERERALERELGGAEGRLKGAAALQGLNGKASGTNVVSHFVRDILQDNASLQAGIAELRELLQTSNDEVQNLREQILEHQPIDYDLPDDDTVRCRPLSEQIDRVSTPKQVQQEVHVHHHYHAKIANKNQRTPTVRRTSRKRAIIGLGPLPSTPESSIPSTPATGPHRIGSSPILPISLYQSQARKNRWSYQSAATGTSQISSFPSSPRSYFDRSSTIFDRIEAGEDSSRPTSPESAVGLIDPVSIKTYEDDVVDQEDYSSDVGAEDGFDESRLSDTLIEEESAQEEQQQQTYDPETWSREVTPKPSLLLSGNGLVESQHKHQPSYCVGAQAVSSSGDQSMSASGIADTITPATKTASAGVVADETQNPADAPDLDFTEMLRPSLRRTGSHESLVSISGMDIHLAKRPTTSTSQPTSLLKGNRSYFARAPSAARTAITAQPLATVTEFTALSSMRSMSAEDTHPTGSKRPALKAPDRSVSLSVEALSGIAGLPSPTGQQEQPPTTGGFSRLVGGWVRSKWGVAPTKSSGDLRAAATSSRPAVPPLPPPDPLSALFGGRPPGINQKGAILGLKPQKKGPAGNVQSSMVDEEGLKESLEE